MDTTSEPDYTEVEVIEVDINFIGGKPLQLTLDATTDKIEDLPDYIRITVPKLGIVSTSERRNITHSDICRRTVRKLTKQPEPKVVASSRSDSGQDWRPSPLTISPLGRLPRSQDEDES